MKYIFTLFVGIFIGLVLGFYQAPIEFKYYDAEYQASINAALLRSLESGRIDHIKTDLEIELDSSLSNHARYLKSPYNWLFFNLPKKDGEAIRSAVAYRQKHPYSSVDLSLGESWEDGVDMNDPFIKDVVSGQIENNQLKSEMLNLYGR